MFGFSLFHFTWKAPTVQAQNEVTGFFPSRISQTCTYESTEDVARM